MSAESPRQLAGVLRVKQRRDSCVEIVARRARTRSSIIVVAVFAHGRRGEKAQARTIAH